VGFITPLVSGDYPENWRYVFAAVWVIFLLMHVLAQRVLATVEE
jgi:hypothetical protein